MSQGLWGALPGPSSTFHAPIHEDVLQVVLSAGSVTKALDVGGDSSGSSSSSNGGDGSGEGANKSVGGVSTGRGSGDAGVDDGASGDRGGVKGDGGGEGPRASMGGSALWLSLPFVAALLPGASPDTRHQAAMSINIALKVL